MKFSIISVCLIIVTTLNTFKTDQQKYERVRDAYKEKSTLIETLLANHNISIDKIHIYLRAFKEEQYLELWAKNVDDKQYQLLRTYEVCNNSGGPGPKRKQGDLQVPEGFYQIDRFNPWSNYHLSLGINYPNKSDRKISSASKLGGDIFIHGNCVTIGCLPMTDDKMKEIYILAVEATNNGQNTIPVSLFPFAMNEKKIKHALENYEVNSETMTLWSELRQGYEIFNKTKKLPSITFLVSGRHLISE